MKARKIITTLVLFLFLFVFVLVLADPALAGPGGKIARSLFSGFWGKLILGLLVIVFLPLIILSIFKEKRAERRARKDLRFLSSHSSLFEWIMLKQRITDCFQRVHKGWQQEDLQEASAWMTSWYWQNQQSVYLDEWARNGLTNICSVKTINDIKPMLVVHRNARNDFEESMLVVSISARMQDYLMEKETKKIVEGDKKYKDVEKIWTFTLEQGAWKVSNIEEADALKDYLKMAAEQPEAEKLFGAPTAN
jgi:predicted lipid-binding transport protein (Tim44 family)